ncbi:MAG: type B 50S ribosomal protein L31 [Mycoplasma sp.]|nr:type B 50S ribosomal protein L31 [Mycoplasma sp.]
MKKEIHPENFREVAFKDVSTNEIYIIKSTVNTKEKITHEGKEYPLLTVDISSSSHPFYIGKTTSSKAKGRVERFNKMFSKKA